MPGVILDNFPFVEQYEGNFCGPACAQMILLSKNKVPDDSHPEQTSLFSDVRNDTRGGFPIVERCGGRVLRWESFPRALNATINRRMALQVRAFAVHADTTEAQATARAVRSINAQQAAVALLEDSTHWMVVYGWEKRTSRGVTLPSIVVDGQPVTHLYVKDPNWGYLGDIDVEEWAALLWKVDCGAFNQKFVVVGRP